MKLSELYEARWEGEGPVEGELKDLLKKDCSFLLSQIGDNGLLYRGVGNLGEHVGLFQCGNDQFDVYKAKVRKDRKPLSTAPQMHKIFDEWFDENCGFKARSQTVFCFGEGGKRSAESYGSKKCVMFPIGKFNYVWSPQVDDLYEVLDELISYGELKPAYRLDKTTPNPEAIGEWLKSKKYTINGLRDAVKTNCEIMIECDYVYYIWYHKPDTLQRLHSGLGIEYKE